VLNRSKFFLPLFICLAVQPHFAFAAFEPIYLGRHPLLPGLVGIPEDEYKEKILPGFLQRAEANQELAADIYGEQKLLEALPHGKVSIVGHPGYWPELVGRLGDYHFMRFVGFDQWRLRLGRYVIGEENGANVGGTEFMSRGSEILQADKKYGAIPYNRDIFERLVSHIHEISTNFYGHRNPLTIVIADEASKRSEPVEVAPGKFVEPPFAIDPQMIDYVRESYRAAGAEWVSLVDERGRLYTQDGVLYLKSEDGQVSKRVDVLWTMADIESIDPKHTPQWKRNIEAHRDNLNDNALLVGIRGIVETWVEGKFLWINNPTSTLTRTKLWPILVDELIQLKTGKPPILPYQKTMTCLNPDGSYNPEPINMVRRDPRAYVLKQAIGDGGEQVWIGSSDFANSEEVLKFIDEKFEPWARSNPRSVIIQPEVELDQIELPDGTKRAFDIRQIALVSGHADTFRATPNRDLFFRISGPGKKKVNIKGGGMIAIATPAAVDHPQVLPPQISIGVNQVNFSHDITPEQHAALLQDGAERALVEAHVLRDIYFHPKEFFARFPRVKSIVENSMYYRPQHFQNRSLRFPSYFMSGPDYMEKIDDPYAALEHNVTNVGGLIRLWILGIPEVKEMLQQFFAELRNTLGLKEPYMIYFLEHTNLGADWAELKNRFFEDFGVELVTSTEVSEGRFNVVAGRQLHYRPRDTWRKVDAFVSNFEPDFLDPSIATDEELLKIMTPEELQERRSHSIPGIGDVIRAGNLLMVNEPGQDIVCSKALLPFMAEFRKFYLKKDEVIPTQPSYSFVDDPEVLVRVQNNHTIFVTKNGEMTGNANGVGMLRKLQPLDRQLIFSAVQAMPPHFMAQELAIPKKNLLGIHGESRVFTIVKVDLASDAPPQVVAQSKEIYVRAAEGNEMANLLPSKDARAAGIRPGFRVPVRVRSKKCVNAVADLAAMDPSL
jgi:uncharacterized circularly permuted ATP-grasp superfamily protein